MARFEPEGMCKKDLDDLVPAFGLEKYYNEN